MNIINSSEMLCSLRFESMGGCPYNMFTPLGAAALSGASVFCALISLLAGM